MGVGEGVEGRNVPTPLWATFAAICRKSFSNLQILPKEFFKSARHLFRTSRFIPLKSKGERRIHFGARQRWGCHILGCSVPHASASVQAKVCHFHKFVSISLDFLIFQGL